VVALPLFMSLSKAARASLILEYFAIVITSLSEIKKAPARWTKRLTYKIFSFRIDYKERE